MGLRAVFRGGLRRGKIGVKKFTREVRQVLCRSSGSSLEKLEKRTCPFGNPLVSVARGSAD